MSWYRQDRKLFASFALACAMVAFAAASLASDAAAASPCKRFGDTEPSQLRAGQARKAITCLVNKQRDSAGVASLDQSKKLQKAAQEHSDEMTNSGCFSHECPGEPELDIRLEDTGYLIDGLLEWMYGENIAWGQDEVGTPKAIVNAWMNSAGHRANILHPAFRDIGVGYATGTPSSKSGSGGMYTVDFGLRNG